MADQTQQNNKKKRNTMYYKQPLDRDLIRDSDMGTEDAADPMETDGYGPEQEEGGWNGEPNFSVPMKADQKDGLGPVGITAKLRKKGMPKA